MNLLVSYAVAPISRAGLHATAVAPDKYSGARCVVPMRYVLFPDFFAPPSREP